MPERSLTARSRLANLSSSRKVVRYVMSSASPTIPGTMRCTGAKICGYGVVITSVTARSPAQTALSTMTEPVSTLGAEANANTSAKIAG